jgi:hypothetical protein
VAFAETAPKKFPKKLLRKSANIGDDSFLKLEKLLFYIFDFLANYFCALSNYSSINSLGTLCPTCYNKHTSCSGKPAPVMLGTPEKATKKVRITESEESDDDPELEALIFKACNDPATMSRFKKQEERWAKDLEDDPEFVASFEQKRKSDALMAYYASADRQKDLEESSKEWQRKYDENRNRENKKATAAWRRKYITNPKRRKEAEASVARNGNTNDEGYISLVFVYTIYFVYTNSNYL